MILLFCILFTFLLNVHVSVHLFVLTYNQALTVPNQTTLPKLVFVTMKYSELKAELYCNHTISSASFSLKSLLYTAY